MSGAVRFACVLALILGAILFISALQEDGGDDPLPVRNGNGEPEEKIATALPAKPGVLDSPENCKECHEEIYKEWEESYHGQAWVDPLFKQLTDEYRDESCYSCHAPRPIHETGLQTAEDRGTRRPTGVDCLSCHKRGNNVVGPIKDPRGYPGVSPDCGPAYAADHATADAQAVTVRYCGVCHAPHGTDKEFLGSKYAREGMSCLSCHMEEVYRPIVKGGKPRKSRRHNFPGAHSVEMLRTAMTVTADFEKESGSLTVRAINQGAGHRIPTDARHRAIHLRVAFFDAYGAPVAYRFPPNERPGREQTVDLIRLFYRHEQKEPTQIDPAGTIGKNNWREVKVPVPDGALGGKAVAKLYYLLVYSWPVEHKGVLVAQKEVSLAVE